MSFGFYVEEGWYKKGNFLENFFWGRPGVIWYTFLFCLSARARFQEKVQFATGSF